MAELKQDIRFCTARDGVRIAYATMGKGPALFWAPHYLSHLEFDLKSPIWMPWLEALTRRNLLICNDMRGCGLSDRAVADLAFETYVTDMEAVADAARLEQFTLFGMSQGAAASIVYAARHPERVSRLVIYGGFARGVLRRDPTEEQVRAAHAMVELVEVGWGSANPAYRQLFTTMFMPDATPEQAAWFNEQQRTCATPDTAARIMTGYNGIDVTAWGPRVRCPTLVMHLRDDLRVPFEEGRLIAQLIPGARFVPLEGRNHVTLGGSPEFVQVFAEMYAFLQATGGAAAGGEAFPDLTARERQILELLAHGLDNSQIAARLDLSEKTVRNNITPILDKLQVETRAQAIVRAREAGFAASPLPKAL
jgi:pimeloyl-ACP methyl ester carboxylesterase/DNA-binding CsgD family transcriptional regulator